jgi:hypothetical protein
MKPAINSVKVHPQLSHNRHPVDGELVGMLVHSLSPPILTSQNQSWMPY